MSNDSIAAKPWQAKISRRRFLGGGIALAGAAGLAGYLPEALGRAATASAATRRPFDLSQVKHLVFLMQENRSFDHYFGTFPGVAGFSDPRAVSLPGGLSVFQQPDPYNPDGYLEPFHISTITTGAAAIPDLSHDWRPQHNSWNNGTMDGWLRSHTLFDGPTNGPYTMGYYTQEDIPFHWALAQAFTLADHYHCSVMGPTTPNRIMWMDGTNDPQGTLGGGPVLDTAGIPNLTLETGVETMYNAGISFKTYFSSDYATPSQGLSASGVVPYVSKFPFANASSLPPQFAFQALGFGTLWGDGTPGGLGNPAKPTQASNIDYAFEEDCANGVLPDVSFVLPWTAAREHPSVLPAAGAQMLASKLDALAANDDLWNSTVFVIQYDENDGFFDHVVPPTPDKAEFPEEFVASISADGSSPGEGFPVGGGFRVPCWIISPWSTGGQVFSGVSDHTSCLQMIESVAAAGGLSGRNSIRFPNISRWRRQTFGDLTGALSGPARLAPASREFDPGVRAANLAAQTAASKLPQPVVPARSQSMPAQLKN